MDSLIPGEVSMLIHIGSFIHWFMGSFIHWFTKALIHWMIHSFFHSLVHWFAHWHVDSLSPSFIDPIIHWLAHSLVHWLINSLTQPSVHWFFHVIDSLSFCRHLNNHLLMCWCALWPQLFIASASQRVPIGHWFLIAIAIFGNICPARPGTGHYRPPAVISAMIRSEPCEQIIAQTVPQSGGALYYERVIGSGGQSVRERVGEWVGSTRNKGCWLSSENR